MKHFNDKSLPVSAIIAIRNATSVAQCVLSCYYETAGCLAVNVIATSDVIRCEMTTGLSNQSEMVDDASSVLYVNG